MEMTKVGGRLITDNHIQELSADKNKVKTNKQTKNNNQRRWWWWWRWKTKYKDRNDDCSLCVLYVVPVMNINEVAAEAAAAAAVVGCVRVRCCRRVWPVVEMSWVITAVGRLVSVLDEPNFSTTSAPRPTSSSLLRPSCVHLCLASQITPALAPYFATLNSPAKRTTHGAPFKFHPLFFSFSNSIAFGANFKFYKLQLFDYRHLVLSNTWTKLEQRN